MAAGAATSRALAVAGRPAAILRRLGAGPATAQTLSTHRVVHWVPLLFGSAGFGLGASSVGLTLFNFDAVAGGGSTLYFTVVGGAMACSLRARGLRRRQKPAA